MIINKVVKIQVVENLTSNYIEKELSKLNLDILSWAIVEIDENHYTLNISVVTD